MKKQAREASREQSDAKLMPKSTIWSSDEEIDDTWKLRGTDLDLKSQFGSSQGPPKRRKVLTQPTAGILAYPSVS